MAMSDLESKGGEHDCGGKHRREEGAGVAERGKCGSGVWERGGFGEGEGGYERGRGEGGI